MSKSRRTRRAAAVPIVPVAERPDRLSTLAKVPEAVTSYLDGLRLDDLSGLLGSGTQSMSGGGWTNTVTGHGDFSRDKVMQGSYQESYRISDVELSALYNGNDLAKRIIETVPKEMFRRGWVLVVPQKDSNDDPDNDGDRAPEDTSGGPGLPAGGETGPASPGSPLVDAGAGVSDFMGTIASSGANGNNPSPRPSSVSVKTPAKDGAPETPGGDQGEGAKMAIAAEAYAATLGLKPRCLEASIFGRAFGGGIMIIGADDGLDMALPLDETNIRSIKYLSWIDRRFVFASSWYSEIGPKFGEVQTWQIINPFGGQSNTVVHESRVVRFDGAPVDFLMRRRLLGWTLSVLQAPYDTLRQFDLSFQSISNLMADMSQAVMKINGLAQLISNDQQTLQTRMQMVDISRSSARMLYIDAENEEFERVPTPLTGVADTLQMQMLRTAAAAEMPVAILFGREPSGLNATGDADFRRFYNVTAGTQRTDLEPKLLRLYTLIFAAKDGPTGGVLPAKALEFVWHKLYEPSEKEQAEIRWLMAQADDKYVTNKTLLPEEVAMSRFRSGDLHLDTEIRVDLREEALKSAELAPSGAAAAEQEAEQAKDLAVTSANAKAGAAGPPGAAKPKPKAAKAAPKKP